MNILADQKDVYLLGELYIDADQSPQVEDLELYHPVTGSGNRVRLHYARPVDLAGVRHLVAIRGREGGDAEGVEGVVLGGVWAKKTYTIEMD